MRIAKILLIFLFLSGCSPYSNKFDCKVGKGVGCKSISQVNEMVDNATRDLSASDKNKIVTEDLNYNNIDHYLPDGMARTKEKIIRVWIAPYKADSNMYVQEQYVYKVVDAPRWVRITG